MAGGKGTRLQSIAQDIPKPMFPVCGKPILEYQIESLKKSGVREIILIVGYRKESVRSYFGSGERFGVRIDYVEEATPLGTAGAFYYLKERVRENFLLLFGDLMLDVDFERFMAFHKACGARITLFGHPNSHPYDSDVIVEDTEHRVKCILSKRDPRDFYYHNLTNAGLYCVSPDVLDTVREPVRLDLEKNVISPLLGQGVYVYRSTEYVKDMGTPDRLQAVERDVKSGLVAQRSLRNRQKAIFLDRDGTINRLVGFLRNAEQLELLPGAAEAIRRVNESSYLAIVATNQPVVARGECTMDELDTIHRKLESELGRQGAFLDDLYFCPHHPDRGFAGEIPELKINCDCRKPKTGLLTSAAEQHNINLSASWYIGDSTMDIQTGCNAGMHTALLRTGEAGKDGRYDAKAELEADNLLDAVNEILKR